MRFSFDLASPSVLPRTAKDGIEKRIHLGLHEFWEQLPHPCSKLISQLCLNKAVGGASSDPGAPSASPETCLPPPGVVRDRSHAEFLLDRGGGEPFLTGCSQNVGALFGGVELPSLPSLLGHR